MPRPACPRSRDAGAERACVRCGSKTARRRGVRRRLRAGLRAPETASRFRTPTAAAAPRGRPRLPVPARRCVRCTPRSRWRPCNGGRRIPRRRPASGGRNRFRRPKCRRGVRDRTSSGRMLRGLRRPLSCARWPAAVCAWRSRCAAPPPEMSDAGAPARPRPASVRRIWRACRS